MPGIDALLLVVHSQPQHSLAQSLNVAMHGNLPWSVTASFSYTFLAISF